MARKVILLSDLVDKLTEKIPQANGKALNTEYALEVAKLLQPNVNASPDYSMDQLPYIGYLVYDIFESRYNHFGIEKITEELVKKAKDFTAPKNKANGRINVFKAITSDYKGCVNDYAKALEYSIDFANAPQSQVVFGSLIKELGYDWQEAHDETMLIMKADPNLKTFFTMQKYIKDFNEQGAFTKAICSLAKSSDNLAAQEYANLRRKSIGHDNALNAAMKYVQK